MQHAVCLMCHDNVKVPVELLFRCQCLHRTRVCIDCAHQYLELNLPKAERVESRKCLYCSFCVHPPFLTERNSYKKDSHYMTLDTVTTYSCFHEDCTFQGSQMELDQHYHNECPYRKVVCPGRCGGSYIANQEADHQENCSKYVTCVYCTPYRRVLEVEFTNHLDELHDEIICDFCKFNFPKVQIQDHQEICEARPICCFHCNIPTTALEYQKHLLHHMEDFTNKIGDLQQDILKTFQELKDLKLEESFFIENV